MADTDSPPTPELSADGELWGRLSTLHSRVNNTVQKMLQRNAHIGPSEFTALLALAGSPIGELHMQELAEVTDLNQSSVSRLVVRLERTGLTERRHCEMDRRRVYTGITDIGRKALAEALPVYEAALAEAFNHIAADPELAPLLARLRAQG